MNFLSFLSKNNSESSEFVITGTKRDYSDMGNYDVALKVWLPEAVDIALKEMGDYSNTSVSTILRHTLFTYLYGRYDQLAAIEKNMDLLISEGNSQLAFSQELTIDKRTTELGKNAYDIKVWISKRMKSDLQKLADEAGIKLSVFIREILVSSLFGHAYLSERREMVSLKVEID